MKKYKKYISLTLLFALVVSNFAIAQSKNSEVVMTKTELEAFLSKIAQLKKDQLLKKQAITRRNNQIDDSLINLIQKNQEIDTKDKFLFDEIERLNNRIDFLLLNQTAHGSSTNSTGIIGETQSTIISQNSNEQQPTITKIEPKNVQPPENIQKSSDLSRSNNQIRYPEKYEKTLIRTQPSNTTINNYYSTQEKHIPNNQIKRQSDTIIIYQENNEVQKSINELAENQSQELSRLKNQISGLNEQIRVLSLLDLTLKDNNNKDEIKALEAKVEELSNNLSAQSKTVDTIVQIREITKEEPIKSTSSETEISKNFKSFIHTIYFENNSIKIDAKDNTSITELANMVKTHTPNVTVVLRGFASNVGTAQYNNKISFNRAEAVRNALIKNGLKARDIVMLNHGIDKSTDDAKARRVEITLLTY